MQLLSFVKQWPTYRELLKQVKDRIDEVDAREAQASSTAPPGSTSASRTSGTRGTSPAPSTSRAATSSRRIESVVPDRSTPVVLYCASGNRSAFAAKTLLELGYERPMSLEGGFTDWKRNGYEIVAAAHALARRSARATRATC